MRIAISSILFLAVLCVSCSRSAPPPAPAAQPPARQKTVFDEQLKAIDKAKAVQDTMNQRAAELDKKVDEADQQEKK